jgi:3-oxoacyl-[acyl-carrier-protein] synthase-3
VLPIANLYHAAQSGKIHENDLVLVYTIGSASTAAATVIRWGEVAVGPVPSLSEPQSAVRSVEDKIPVTR